MTEPKYKIGQTVQLDTGATMIIESVDWIRWSSPFDKEQVYMWEYHGSGNVITEQYIKGLCFIYPDYGEVYCKDCENNHVEPGGDYACHIMQWAYEIGAICACGTFDDTVQPPPNCHCFKPRVK